MTAAAPAQLHAAFCTKKLIGVSIQLLKFPVQRVMSDSDSEPEQLVGCGDDDADWEGWGGDGGGEEEAEDDDATASLFSPATLLPSPEAALAHDAAQHGFDLRSYRVQHGLDEYGVIQLVNFIRSEVAAGRDPRAALAAVPAASSSGGAAPPWAGDAYLTPVLADDPLLTYDYEGEDEEGEELRAAAGSGQPGASCSSAAANGAAAAAAAGGGDDAAALRLRLAALASENRELSLRLAALMELALPDDVRQELREEQQQQQGGGSSSSAAAAGANSSGSSVLQQGGNGPSSSSSAPPPAGRRRGLAGLPAGVGGAVGGSCSVDAAYYESYSALDIHHDMLSDRPRTNAYRDALTRNPGLLTGARVLDVGTGSGVLSLFAARGGAASVTGLDGSERIARLARQVVAANGLDAASGGPISIVTGRVEELRDIGTDQVDVLVSEWMGYGLLFESMLGSVLAARDAWLKPGGAMLPDRASIRVAGASDAAFGTTFWQDVYGFSMAPIGAEVAAAAAREGSVLVRLVDPRALMTRDVTVHSLDLATMAPGDQDFSAEFSLSAFKAAAPERPARADDAPSCSIAALVVWFDVQFSERFCKEHPVSLPTGPDDAPTHWAQVVLPLATPVPLAPGGSMACRLSMARSRLTHRTLDISLEVTPAGQPGARQARSYSMEVTG